MHLVFLFVLSLSLSLSLGFVFIILVSFLLSFSSSACLCSLGYISLSEVISDTVVVSSLGLYVFIALFLCLQLHPRVCKRFFE